MQYQGKRNCIRCTRWRPISDYNLKYRFRKCIVCIRKHEEEYRRKNGISPKSVDSYILINIMKKLGWSNKEIADNAKVNTRRVYDWMNGRENIGLMAADNLCIILGIDLNSLI